MTPSQRQKKVTRIQALLKRLKAKKVVTARDFKVVLTPEQIKQYDEELSAKRQWLQNALSANADSVYLEYVKKGDFFYNRMNHFSLKGKHKTAERFSIDSQKWYERAFEHLASLPHSERLYFDRDVSHLDFNERSDLGLYPEGIPRPMNSKSVYKMADDKLDIRAYRIKALEVALSELQSPNAYLSQSSPPKPSPAPATKHRLTIDEIEARLAELMVIISQGDMLSKMRLKLKHSAEIEQLQSQLSLRKLQARLLAEDDDGVYEK